MTKFEISLRHTADYHADMALSYCHYASWAALIRTERARKAAWRLLSALAKRRRDKDGADYANGQAERTIARQYWPRPPAIVIEACEQTD